MDLSEMTKEQLTEQAQELGVSVAAGASKAALRAAIESHVAQAQQAAPSESAGQPLTAEQAAALRAAPAESIRKALATQPHMPALWRAAFELELTQRGPLVQTSEIQQWRVVNGGRYCIPGHATTLAKDSVITEYTHDLDDVRAQGLVLEPITSVTVYEDQLGFAKTRVEV